MHLHNVMDHTGKAWIQTDRDQRRLGSRCFVSRRCDATIVASTSTSGSAFVFREETSCSQSKNRTPPPTPDVNNHCRYTGLIEEESLPLKTSNETTKRRRCRKTVFAPFFSVFCYRFLGSGKKAEERTETRSREREDGVHLPPPV